MRTVREKKFKSPFLLDQEKEELSNANIINDEMKITSIATYVKYHRMLYINFQHKSKDMCLYYNCSNDKWTTRDKVQQDILDLVLAKAKTLCVSYVEFNFYGRKSEVSTESTWNDIVYTEDYKMYWEEFDRTIYEYQEEKVKLSLELDFEVREDCIEEFKKMINSIDFAKMVQVQVKNKVDNTSGIYADSMDYSEKEKNIENGKRFERT